jgi:iron complex transport system substrate-binding protein
LALVPEGSQAKPDLPAARILAVPAKRVVVASGHYDAGIMAALGRLPAMVATDEAAETWRLPEVKAKIESGGIAFVGYWDALDFEAIRRLEPDLVLTSSPEMGQTLEGLGFPTIVTYNGLDNGLENRLRLIGFLGAVLGAEEAAAKITAEVRAALGQAAEAAAGLPRTKLGWGVFFKNRVYALDGDFWLAEIFAICGGEYVMAPIRSGMGELDLEAFLANNAEAGVYFASLLHEGQVETKEQYLSFHPQLARVKAFGPEGRVWSPEDLLFQDTGHLADIVRETAAVIHPELYPGHESRFFRELP